MAVRFSLVGKKQAKIQCRVVSDKIGYENIHDPYEGKVVFYLKALKWATENFTETASQLVLKLEHVTKEQQ